VELWSQWLGVDHDRVVAFYLEDADLEKRPVCCWADEHRQVVVQIRLIAFRTACHMSGSVIPCFRAGSPIRT
jgi:hypothetical protein